MTRESGSVREKAGSAGASLYSRNGRRKYINAEERRRILEVLSGIPSDERAFCLTLMLLGLRISEALALRPEDVQFEEGIVAVRCLKKRGTVVVREVPAPPELLSALKGLAEGHEDPQERFWLWSRVSAWRVVKTVLRAAGVRGDHAMPKGFRHGFGVHAVRSGVPLDLIQRWLGHADIATTAIYTHVMGSEERAVAARMW